MNANTVDYLDDFDDDLDDDLGIDDDQKVGQHTYCSSTNHIELGT